MSSTTLAPKDPDVAATYSIDWHEQIVRLAARDSDFLEAVFVRPQVGNGFYYECTQEGRSSAYYPIWVKTPGLTVADGSVIWTCRTPSESIPVVTSAVWIVPDGLTQDDQQELGSVTYITVSGGTDGVDYELTCTMTPSAGLVAEQTIIIPVRAL